MKFFLSYIKHRLPVLVILAVCTVVFTAAFALYGVPVGAALYPVYLSSETYIKRARKNT